MELVRDIFHDFLANPLNRTNVLLYVGEDEPSKDALREIVEEGEQIGYENLSQEKKDALVLELQDWRDQKETGIVRSNKAHLHDALNTLERVQQEVSI